MATTDVFKFVSVRPPQLIKPTDDRTGFAKYPKGEKAPLHEKLSELEGDDARLKATKLATKHIESDEYRALMKELEEAGPKMTELVKRASAKPKLSDAKAIVQEGLCMPIPDFLEGDGALLRDHLWDAVYAHSLAPDESPADRDAIYRGVRAIHFIELLSTETSKGTPINWASLLGVRPTLPPGLIPDVPADEPPDDDDDDDGALEKVRAIRDRIIETKKAIKDLGNTHRLYQRTRKQDAELETSPSRSRAGPRLTAHEFAASMEKLPGVDPKVMGLLPSLKNFSATPEPEPWIYREFGSAHLKPETRALLDTQKDALVEKHPLEVMEALENNMVDEATEFVHSLTPKEIDKIAHTKEMQQILEMTPIMYTKTKPIPYYPRKVKKKPAYPTAKGRGIRPLGIGDLLVVREELLKYTTGEVAHIENVLKGEYKDREHRRLRQTEEIVITETEHLEETEKDLQTTERFELHKETEETLKADLSFAAGVSVSGSYGMVTFGASADFATSTAREESNRSATDYAKEVTERSVQRIMTRTREERTRRTLEEFEETNKHGIDNKEGDGHVIGVYRWVDKYYTARIHNYGKRLMFEFIVPEPAAFYIHSEASRSMEGVTMTPPDEPLVYGTRRLRPDDLTNNNYMKWVSKYDVQDVEPYPPALVTVGMAFAESSGQKQNIPTAKAYKELQVPDGYVADWRSISRGWLNRIDDGWDLDPDLRVGRGIYADNRVEGLEGIIPVSIEGSFATFAANIVIGCDRKASTLTKWRLKTFTAIINAYNRLLSEYNEHVAAASIQQGIAIQGRNPEINRRTEREELQKECLRILTNEYAHTKVGGDWLHHELFNAMNPSGSFGFPELKIGESIVEGKIIQFFEQAFEWQNLTYLFYPYFWGRKNNWLEIFPLGDTDPKFRDFLRAGAARVVVPVHPAYMEAVLHYFSKNEIWNGGQPPTLYDPLYISIVDEIRAATGADQREIVGEWEVKLPTSLVYLQEDASLPDFSEDHGE